MPKLPRTSAAELAIHELAAQQPDGGSAMRRELARVEDALGTFPGSGKKVAGHAGISIRSMFTSSGRYQVVYYHRETTNEVLIENVVSTRSSMRT